MLHIPLSLPRRLGLLTVNLSPMEGRSKSPRPHSLGINTDYLQVQRRTTSPILRLRIYNIAMVHFRSNSIKDNSLRKLRGQNNQQWIASNEASSIISISQHIGVVLQ
jgi:hypothetical protein